MNPARRHATYDDLLQVPDIFIAEIVDGELITSPRPAFPHARAASVIRANLDPYDRSPGSPDSPGGWWILFEPELHLGPDILVPDLAGWRRERMPVLENISYTEQAPDWVCEIISPSTAQLDRIRKMRVYAREQVGHLWLVDPLMRTLEVYRLEGHHWIVAGTYGGAEAIQAEPFAALTLDLSRWWVESSPT